MAGELAVQGVSIFDASQQNQTSLLQLQTSVSNPLIPELPTTTGMVLPDLATYDRLSHFPEDLYDLRPESHLVRLLKALMGDSGAGQLRKRYLLAQLEQSLNSTHFYDLDRFYGALFGARRGISGSLPFDPMENLATPDGWDEISTFDTQFRERIIKLAKAITMGGTPMGMQAIAEALTGVECDVYEVWRQIDGLGSAGAGRTYAQVETDFASYSAMGTYSWDQVAGVTTYGNLAINARNEFIIRPKKVYSVSDPVLARQRAEDIYGIMRVVNVLKPAFTIASVDDKGLAMHQKVPIAAVSADSEYWEVVTRVLPRAGHDDVYSLVYRAYDKRANPTGIQKVVPRPPFSSSQGRQWSYVSEVAKVEAQSTMYGSNDVVDSTDYDTVTFYDGKKYVYQPNYALADAKTIRASQAAGDGSLLAHPYSGARKVVPVHG